MKASIAAPIFSLILATSCSSIGLQNSLWCASKGSFGARCGYLVPIPGKPNFSMSEEEYKAWSYGKVTTSAETFSSWKAAIKKMCQDNQGQCYWYQEEKTGAENAVDSVLKLTQ